MSTSATPSSHQKTILVAVDFSTGSRAALEHAIRLAAQKGMRLHLLHVVDSVSLALLAERHHETYESAVHTATLSGRKALKTWLAQSPMPGSYDETLVIGHPLHEILEHAKSMRADLLVAGIAGVGGNTLGAGSTASKLTRKSSCDILLVRSGHPQPFQRLIAALDFSSLTKSIVQATRDLALAESAEVDWLHIWSDPGQFMPVIGPLGESGFTTLPVDATKIDEQLRQQLHEQVQAASAGLKTNEVLCEDSRVGHGIAQHAEACGADLIVLGAHGHSALHYVLLGSTPERLLTRLTCSMLVVKK